MTATLQDRLRSLEVTEPVNAGRLQVFGLRWEPGTDVPYVTLDEALAAEDFEVTEVSESGSVPSLLVRNHSDRQVFLLAGEQLVGAKQNRVLNVSLLVAAGCDLEVPVSCVERGRWGYKSPRFRSGGSASHGHLRRKMARYASQGYRAQGRPTAHQGEVWREVARKLRSVGSRSSSAALHQAFEDNRKKLDAAIAAVQVPRDCHGVVFACCGRIAGVDLFDKPETLQKLLPKLVRSYSLDALEARQTGRLNREEVESWLAQVAGAAFERYDSPGLGDDIRLASKRLVGGGLVVKQSPVHVELYPEEEEVKT